MGDVVNINVATTLDIPPERVLTGAVNADLESAIVLGWTKDGDLYFASSVASSPDILWMLEQTKRILMDPE